MYKFSDFKTAFFRSLSFNLAVGSITFWMGSTSGWFIPGVYGAVGVGFAFYLALWEARLLRELKEVEKKLEEAGKGLG